MLHSMKMMRLRMGYYALFLGGVGSSEEYGLPLTWALLLRDANWSKWLTSQMDLHKWCWQHNSYTPTHPNKLSLQSQWPILHIQHGSHLHTGYLRRFTTLLRVGTWGQLIFQGGFVDQSIRWDTFLVLNQQTSKWALWQTYCVYRA